MFRRINLSAAVITLVCFFLPWEQVSCGGAKDTLTGLDLARHGHASLWWVLVLMGGLVLMALLRAWRNKSRLFAIVSAACGAVTAYLMNSERLRVHDESGLITVQLTGWFWLGLLSALAVAGSAVALLFKRQRTG